MGRRTDEFVVEWRRLSADARSHVRDEGLGSAARAAASLAFAYAGYPIVRRRRHDASFCVGHVTLPYELGRYNRAWLNERTVEIPIAKTFLMSADRPVLEVGNVLGHYGLRGHLVLDRYESVAGVVNEDITAFRPTSRFKTIVSVSTLEHVGFDEPIQDAEGPVKALSAMRESLLPGGRLLVTCPLGYNPGLDSAVREGRFAFDRTLYLKRVSRDNDWREVDQAEALEARYGFPFRNGNVVLVGLDGDGIL